MKKRYIILIGIGVLIVPVWIIGRITGAFQYCTSATPSNYPTLKVDTRFMTSNLIKPKRFDFISYQPKAEYYKGQRWVHRLCGLGGDKIEIKNSVLYVNDINCDATLTLAHVYKISKSKMTKLKVEIEEERILDTSSDSLWAIFDDREIKKLHLNAIRVIEPIGIVNRNIKLRYGFDWNIDNFGPLVIPKDMYFVLGDNRNNALDSRYTGLISKSEVMATVIDRN